MSNSTSFFSSPRSTRPGASGGKIHKLQGGISTENPIGRQPTSGTQQAAPSAQYSLPYHIAKTPNGARKAKKEAQTQWYTGKTDRSQAPNNRPRNRKQAAKKTNCKRRYMTCNPHSTRLGKVLTKFKSTI